MFTSKRNQVLIFFVLVTTTLLFRVNVEQTRYCTPDSKYYLEVSRNMQNGLGPVGPKVFEVDAEKNTLIPLYDTTRFGSPETYEPVYFAVWPLGYPLCIWSTSTITFLDPLWASKVVNLILLGIDFYLLFLLFGEFSILSIFYFGSFTMLEITSYTWSENLFLTAFLAFFLALKKINEEEVFSIHSLMLLIFTLFWMCFARYASVIFYALPFYVVCIYGLKKEWGKFTIVASGVGFSLILLGIYLYHNYTQTGHLTGMPRVGTQEYDYVTLIQKFITGQFNQLHIIKQYRFSGTTDFLFYCFTIATQIGLMVYIGYTLIKNPSNQKLTYIQRLLLYSGILYLIFLTYMTFTSTIDAFDYRTLLPYSFPLLIVLLSYLEERLTKANQESVLTFIKLFFILSLALNLPKKFILDYIS